MAILDSVVLEHQSNDQWCWAAVTLGICRFFGDVNLSQERIVCMTLNNDDCSDSPTPDECNIPFPLELALKTFGHLSSQTGVLPFSDLQEQIDNQRRPVAISVIFQNELGVTNHYCLVKGCQVLGTLEEVTLLDPSGVSVGESQIAYADLCSGAALGGPWTQSFTVV